MEKKLQSTCFLEETKESFVLLSIRVAFKGQILVTEKSVDCNDTINMKRQWTQFMLLSSE